MLSQQFILPIAEKLIVDLFAGGGGASTGIERALGRHVDIAVNHNPDAISMHEANHPQTRHYLSDVWEVDPIEVVDGMPVGLLHLSPDCTHHSQARGGQPRSKKIRALAWVGHRWIGKLRKRGLGPDLATLENVEQMLQWSPLIAKRCTKTGRVIRLDGSVAPKGEHTPLEQQFLVPDPKRKGQTWAHFVEGLRRMGGQVQWRKIVAADHGAHTTRERLFMIARFDGLPIVWPTPTHAKTPAKGLKRWGSAAACIDFTTPCPSIFTRPRPLADATLKRIAKGVRKYVLDAAEPFVVATGHTGFAADRSNSANDPLSTVVSKAEHCLVAPTVMPLTHQGGVRVNDPTDPLRTITGANRGELALAAPTLVQTGYGERAGQEPRALDMQAPLGTVMAEGVKHAVVTPMLIQAGHGEGKPDAPRWSHGTNDIQGPMGTVTASGGGQALAAATLVQFRFDHAGLPIDQPAPTITAGGASKRPGGNNTLGLATALVVGVGGRAGQTEPRSANEPSFTTTGKADAAMAAVYLAQANDGPRPSVGHSVERPASTITNSGSQQQLVAALLSHAYSSNTCGGEGDPTQPAKTITAGGQHHGLVECTLSPEDEAGALRVAAFLMRYYGEGGQHGDLVEPASTITTKDRLALVTVHIQGTPYVIVDIGLRMLQPAELYRAQGFPADYIIDRGHDGRRFSKSAQVKMCGNSVSPPPMEALIRANYGQQQALRRAA
ncbi:DNA cytosine methyltransferase [Paucibacter sp. DJ1R-11]|uniref:DNA cytosine methyltransferase n=1 Tax=Paucibacter sp. DJ1R-11 TaxID=2893556 RepID=UPI0021E4040E|nr:DNA cytosine methyltransferase [Paucibacter sp. DJ1R-11]MCV2365565.1 DNA cytosine methyltransferase [Paucibacter sp. DJ1R-11]